MRIMRWDSIGHTPVLTKPSMNNKLRCTAVLATQSYLAYSDHIQYAYYPAEKFDQSIYQTIRI